MSINTDYHNVSKVELQPVEIHRIGNYEDTEKYSFRKIIIYIDDRKHTINLFGAELDSLDVSPDKKDEIGTETLGQKKIKLAKLREKLKDQFGDDTEGTRAFQRFINEVEK